MGAMIIGGSECMGRTCHGLCAKYSIMSWRATDKIGYSSAGNRTRYTAYSIIRKLTMLDGRNCFGRLMKCDDRVIMLTIHNVSLPFMKQHDAR